MTWLAAAPSLAGAAGLWLLDSPRREAVLALFNHYHGVLLVFIAALLFVSGRGATPAPGRGRPIAALTLVLMAWVAMNLPGGAGLVLSATGLALALALNRLRGGTRGYFKLQCKFTTIVILAAGMGVWALVQAASR